ncbi:MAG: alpha/beta hydrolase family protein [Candidatus Bathyarchaeia archaeon]|jgi:pimeloyl-ACP methyl ester carboxylesterase
MTDLDNQEVEWNINNIPIHGTITCPKNQKPRASVVFVAGSGPTDRNWCSPLLPGENCSGKLLAEALASEGYLTLRYDKLASGPYVQENVLKMMGKISMQSHLDELSGAVKTLVEAKKADNLFVLTNSEGAIHALNYQLQATVKFKGLILTGAPGRSIGEVARNQIVNQIAALPDKEAILKKYDTAIASFSEGNSIVPDPSLPQGIMQLLLSLNAPFNLPFARELWNYNLSEYISKVEEPILVLISKKDVQVDWQADGKALESAAKGKSEVSFVYPENADHVLKFEDTPKEKLGANATLNYNSPNRNLDPETLKTILDWLRKHTL